jgi:hypothetical protein
MNSAIGSSTTIWFSFIGIVTSVGIPGCQHLEVAAT